MEKEVFKGVSNLFMRIALIGAISGALAPHHATAEVVADPRRFDDAIAAFEESDRQSKPETGQVLFLGSSSIRRWDTAAAFQGIDSINRGFGGSQTSDCLFFFDRIVVPYAPSVIVFYEGDNDIGAGKTVRQVLADFNTFRSKVADRLPQTKVVFIPIKPSIKRASLWPLMNLVNQMIRVRSERDSKLYYADIATPMLDSGMPPDSSLFVEDGLHMSEVGYALWTLVVRKELERALAAP